MIIEIQRHLMPELKKYQLKLEKKKAKLALFYSKRDVEKACHEAFQKAQKNQPAILFPTQEAIKFYKQFASLSTLEKVILEYKRCELSRRLKGLGLEEEKSQRAMDLLWRFRNPQLKDLIQPGRFADYLVDKKILPSTCFNSPRALTKHVRFKS